MSSPVIILATIFILISAQKLGTLPSFEQLENPSINLAAEVYSEDGVILGTIKVENRTWSEYEDISPYVIDALIATEDIRFYRHSGIDPKGLMRVMIKTVLLGQQTGGGSTISQQLAKNLFVKRDLSRDPSIVRSVKLVITKFREWYTAVKLEKSYTKEELITMYLNVFDFIHNAVGIHSAAHIYFNTSPDSLTLEESAMLVGMLKNSVAFDPSRFPKKALARRNVVLNQMERYGYIDEHVADSVKKLPLVLDMQEDTHISGLATYFRQYLANTMRRDKPERNWFYSDDQYEDALWQWENDPLYGWCTKNKKPNGTDYDLYRDGIKIYTTINSHMQKYAEEAVTEHLSKDLQPVFYKQVRGNRNPPYSNDISKEQAEKLLETSVKQSDRYRSLKRSGMNEDSIKLVFNTPVKMKVFSWKGDHDTLMSPFDSIRYYKYFVRSSFMAMDPHSGFVKVYVGGPNIQYFQYDAVTQQRKHVGSTIKPFLYTLAMQDGYSPCYEVANVPRSFENIAGFPDSTWTPRSSGPEEYHNKMVTLKWGLAQSENWISAWVMQQFKPSAVVDLMHRMGIRSFIDPVVSIFLGPADIKLEEMVGAYCTFANNGVYTRPVYVTRIEDRNGNVISTFNPYIDEVITEQDAYLMINLLEGVVTNDGTGARLRGKYALRNEMGGKTGTTQNNSNGWFMGVTPNLVGGVWTGWEDQAIHFEQMSLGQGSNMALPVWGIFLNKLFADPQFSDMANDTFEEPANFNVNLDCDKINKQQKNNNSQRNREY